MTASQELLDTLERLIAQLNTHPDEAVREATRLLLEGLDSMHRAGLTHLVNGIRAMAGEAFITRLTADPAVRLLLMSYDLVAVDRRLLTEDALDAVRGHLFDHGITVELLDVVGGVVYVRLDGRAIEEDRITSALRDIEAALRESLPGFQELVHGNRPEAAGPRGGFISIAALRGRREPVFRRAAAVEDLTGHQLRAVDLDGVPVLLARLGTECMAVANRCGDSPLPLEFGVLSGAELRCSWHGCRYDLRTGHRLDGPGRIAVYPVRIVDGDVMVAVETAVSTPGSTVP